jgi:hypothetical protein
MFISISLITEIRPTVRSYLLYLGPHEHRPTHRAVTNTMYTTQHGGGVYISSSIVHHEHADHRLARPARLERRDDGGEEDSEPRSTLRQKWCRRDIMRT